MVFWGFEDTGRKQRFGSVLKNRFCGLSCVFFRIVLFMHSHIFCPATLSLHLCVLRENLCLTYLLSLVSGFGKIRDEYRKFVSFADVRETSQTGSGGFC